MRTTYDFEGRVALVVGGTSGIGRATALGFARAGASVAVLARGADAGARVEEEIARAGAEGLFVRCDVRDEASTSEAVARVVERFGRLDFAVNCAGAGGDMAELAHASAAVWDDVMAVNARGVFLAMRSEIAAMVRTGGGAIVNMSAVFGQAGKPAHHAYVASKHAVVGLTRSVALEYATRGVRVNVICAGLTRTAGVIAAEAAVPAVVESLVHAHPMGRMATEEEIAAAALWLCSADAAFVTGAPINVDGGFLAA